MCHWPHNPESHKNMDLHLPYSRKISVFLLFSLFNCSFSFASETRPATDSPVIAQALALKLYEQPGWRTLLHYRPATFTRKWVSEVDDAHFFLSKDGKYNPESELIATLNHFLDEKNKSPPPSICQFPARFHWLQEQLHFNTSPSSITDCAAFNQWKEKLDAVGASLIFPAAYLDSPSSMFGHTLLRLDRPHPSDASSLLSYTVSYAAKKTEEDSELEFVYRGLVGGYPGETAIIPYYLKLKEYSDIESRDIWEYPLNLSPTEMSQLIRHLWEVKDIQFNYYFFDENCSYRLLSFLNIVRPEQDLLQGFNTYAIPVDTVRRILNNHWTTETDYRPSVVTKFNHKVAQLNKAQKQQVLSMMPPQNTAPETLETQSETERSLILEVAYDYSRLIPLEQKKAAELSYRLLLERQKITDKNTLKPLKQPDKRDDQGHLSSRISIAWGQYDTEPFISLQWRPAYHDLTDPGQGYPLGSELKFLETEFRSFLNGPTQLQALTLIGIKSIKPRTSFFSPVSWSVAIKASREAISRNDLIPAIEGQIGYAYQIPSGLLYSLIGGDIMIDDDFNNTIALFPKLNLGLTWRNRFIQTKLDYQLKASTESAATHEEKTEFTSVFNLSKHWAAYTTLHHFQKSHHDRLIQLTAGFHYFYM